MTRVQIPVVVKVSICNFKIVVMARFAGVGSWFRCKLSTRIILPYGLCVWHSADRPQVFEVRISLKSCDWNRGRLDRGCVI